MDLNIAEHFLLFQLESVSSQLKKYLSSCSFQREKKALNKLNFPLNLISFTIDMETVFLPPFSFSMRNINHNILRVHIDG